MLWFARIQFKMIKFAVVRLVSSPPNRGAAGTKQVLAPEIRNSNIGRSARIGPTRNTFEGPRFFQTVSEGALFTISRIISLLRA